MTVISFFVIINDVIYYNASYHTIDLSINKSHFFIILYFIHIILFIFTKGPKKIYYNYNNIFDN